MNIEKVSSLKGTVTIPGDKSISHRAVMFGSLAKGTTEVHNFLQGADCLCTIDSFRKMGIEIENTPECIRIQGKGLYGLSKSESVLDMGNSGTTTRLISGILSGQSFETSLSGDASLQSRPMNRIIDPLSQMGANIESIHGNGCAPLIIHPAALKGIHYHSRIASAQVKSAILLAGLYAEGQTSVTEPYCSRNHTELMLKTFGADITSEGCTASINPGAKLEGQKIVVPGDISSAAYFIAAGLIVPGSEILIKNVGINPTRDGIIRVCQEMGGDITLLNVNDLGGEPTADILVRHSQLHGITVEGPLIPTLIDELPLVALLGCYAEGITVIRDAQELKVKESNRIDVMVNNLSLMHANIQATDDGMIVYGGSPLMGTKIETRDDHRIAMTFAIAGLNACGTTEILDSSCINVSYPSFFTDLENLAKR